LELTAEPAPLPPFMSLPKLSALQNKEHSIFNLNKFRDEVQARLSLARDSVETSGNPRSYMGETRSKDFARTSSTRNKSHASDNLASDSEEDNHIRESHDFMQRVEKEIVMPQKRTQASVQWTNKSQSRQNKMIKV
jgi:hypothetical protein